MTQVKAVILDVDGTLIYSNEEHARAFADAARELGIDAPPLQQIRRLIGMGGDKLIPRGFGLEQESGQGEELDHRKGEIFRERYLHTIRATPGTRQLLERLRSDGLKLVVATSAQKVDLEGLLDRAGVRDLIEESTSASEVEESKPDPDVVQAALKQAGCGAGAAVMVGDTPYDVEAAVRAGVRIIGVRSGGWSDQELGGAIGVFDHPADLLAHYRSTPMGAVTASFG